MKEIIIRIASELPDKDDVTEKIVLNTIAALESLGSIIESATIDGMYILKTK